MEGNKYHFSIEIIFTLRSCKAITESVYLHWIDKLTKDEMEALSQRDVSGCVCNEEDKHGWTEIKCCNECGKPIEDFWCKD